MLKKAITIGLLSAITIGTVQAAWIIRGFHTPTTTGWSDPNNPALLYQFEKDTDGLGNAVTPNSGWTTTTNHLYYFDGTAEEPTWFVVTNNPQNRAYSFAANKYLVAKQIQDITNAARGTVLWWTKITTLPGVDDFDTQWSYGYEGGSGYTLFLDIANYAGSYTQCWRAIAQWSSTSQWIYYGTNNSARALTNEWHMIGLHHNGSQPYVTIDGIAQTMATNVAASVNPPFWFANMGTGRSLYVNKQSFFNWSSTGIQVDRYAVYSNDLSSVALAEIMAKTHPTACVEVVR